MNSVDERYIQLLDSIPVPQQELEAAIYEGQRRASQEHRLEQRRHHHQLLKRSLAALLAIIILGGSLIVGSRWSPVLASTLSQIPFVSELVKYVSGNADKGMQDIVEHEYYEVIDKTVTSQHLSLTLKGVIADEYGLVMFYRVAASDSLKFVDVTDVKLSLNGEPMSVGLSFGALHREEEKHADEQIIIESLEPIQYGDKQFELQMTFTDVDHSTITIPFELNKPIAKSKTYELQQEIIVSGQRIQLEELSVSPMRAQLTIKADEQNSLQLLDIEVAELIDEQGESWGKSVNRVVGWGSLRGEQYALNFQSHYFRDPQQLVLRLANIAALPKGEDYIEIDFEQQKVLYQPEAVKAQFMFLPKGLAYTITEQADQFRGSLLSGGVDAAGKELYNHFSTFSDASGELRVQMGFDLDGVVNPVRFPINFYPSYLPDEVEVVIPLVDAEEM